ncbi:ribonuclease E/G [Streptomonospora nanhaiensis]|uniref:Rne/Rng family ribonuclease n=3 Tax=Streptomonospora nanhaiensis TaxID=1323731 RepID=UPI0036148062
MLENEPNSGAEGTAGTIETTVAEAAPAARTATFAPPQEAEVKVSGPSWRRGALRSAGPPPEPEPVVPAGTGPLTTVAGQPALEDTDPTQTAPDTGAAEAERAPRRRTRTARTARAGTGARTRAAEGAGAAAEEPAEAAVDPAASADDSRVAPEAAGAAFQPPMVLFQPPVAPAEPARAESNGSSAAAPTEEPEEEPDEDAEADDDFGDDDRPSRRRRRRGGRGRGRSRTGEDEGEPERAGEAAETAEPDTEAPAATAPAEDGGEPASETGSRRRRRRRRRRTSGEGDEAPGQDDPPNTVVRVREPRVGKPIEDEVQSVKGSTRLEAKKQRRREGREQGRRRAPIITESEFLARRESVKRDLVIRRLGERTQIAVLEDNVLVEHYVDRAAHKSLVGNVYLGRVQNVLPSMEAAFVDIGKGRNAVLYAGEVNWDASGLEGQPKRIESVLKSGQSVLVQVTKDPMGHKGARLTSQISLPGRYLVYVPDGSMTGISRKLPDKERARLKQILKKVMPENAGVIVRTAAEGASEEELERDISRLAAQWDSIKRKSRSASAPSLLNSEPDLTVRVVRDVFNEDFSSLVVAGDEAWDTVREYVDYVAPHLAERLSHWTEDRDVFDAYRIDEQIAKALERKVWLPSGGSLVIDRTEAMTVVDVNTGKFTGQGGNLEETVTKNNLEAAEEIVRQLRLRDIGGIIVIDFIDMVLESNRDLVLRRMLECLSRDRTKHQVAEVTSLGLVQMTRKRVGQGLLEAFSHSCEHCNGRGLVISTEPVGVKANGSGGGGRKKKGKADKDRAEQPEQPAAEESPEPALDEPLGGTEPEPVAGVAAAVEAEDAVEEPDEAVEPAEAAPPKAKRSRSAKSAAKTKEAGKTTARRSRKAKQEEPAESADDGAAAEQDAAAAPEGAAPAGAAEQAQPAESAEAAESGDPDSSAEQRPRRRRTRRTKTTASTESAVAEAT